MSRRLERLSQALRKELAYLLQHQARDPRLSRLITITRASISPDLRECYVSISIMGNEEERKEVLEGLNSASGFFRHELSAKLPWRRVPQLHFQWDDSLEKGLIVSRLIQELSTDK